MIDFGLVLRGAMAGMLRHTYSRQAVTQGAEDAWGDTADTPGTAATALPCVLVWADRLVVDDAGRRTVRVPTLHVPYDDVLAVGDLVTAVADFSGTTIADGPMTVETIDPAAGLGSSALKIAVLGGATVAE